MTDATGNGSGRELAIDPTDNVRLLVEANALAAAMLREADNRYYDLAMSDHKAFDAAGHQHLKEMMDLRASYSKDIRASDLAVGAQTRLVDVGGQAASAASLATAVVALQGITDRNAETLRQAVAASTTALAKQVTDTAAAQALQTNAANAAMEARVSLLEKTSNIGTGRQGVLDPQVGMLVEKLDRLISVQAQGTGKSEGISASWAVLLGVIGLLAGLASIGIVIVKSNGVPAVAPVPQVVYVPTPPATVAPTK